MAIIDNEREVIVVRIVYDGPPLSGKTTSLHSLSKILGQSNKVYSPQEVDGHTILFDWLEYVGGYFKGHSISCQIITVPGQNILKEHREFLLRSADAVIFVIDASHTDQSTLNYFQQTRQALIQQGEETVKIILQANKQDMEGALSSQQLKELFSEYPDLKVIETIAPLGRGIRESFVLAVRLATERASLLMERGRLPIGKPEILTGEALLNQLQNNIPVTILPSEDTVLSQKEIAEDNIVIEQDDNVGDAVDEIPLTLVESSLPKEQLVTFSQTKSLHLPQLPDESITPQWLWPPVLGKKMLTDMFKNRLRPHLKEDKTWVVDSESGWRCFSRAHWQYSDMNQARNVLREYTTLHLQCSPFLSEQRCLALAQEENGWRLWQILQKVPTLTEKLRQALRNSDVHQLVVEVLHCAQYYIRAQQQASHYLPAFNLILDNIGIDIKQQLIYLGCIDNRPADYRLLDTNAALIEALKQAFSTPIVNAQLANRDAIVTTIEQTQLDELDDYIPKVIAELFVHMTH